jgi:hypothetical protein
MRQPLLCRLQVFHVDRHVWLPVNRTTQPEGMPGVSQDAVLLLPRPGFYRTNVCAVGWSGISDASLSCMPSDGVVFDVSPPMAGSVCVGVGAVERCGGELYVTTREVSVHWFGFEDEESGIAKFRWAVGTATASDDVRTWEDTDFSSSVLLPAELTLPWSAVHVTVMCTNRAGLDANTSIKLIFDTSPPTFGKVAGWGEDESIQFESAVAVSIVWPTAEDGESGVSSTRLKVFRTSDATLVVDQDVTAAEPASLTFVASRHTLFTAHLHVTNHAGLESTSPPRRFMHDPQQPANGRLWLCDKEGRTTRVQVRNDSFSLCAVGFGSPPSGMRLHLNISTPQLGSSLLHPTQLLPVPQHGSPIHVPLPMPCGTLIKMTAAAVSGAGLAAPSIEMQLQIDCSPPVGRLVGFRSLASSTASVSADGAVCVLSGNLVDAFWHFDEPETAMAKYFFTITHNSNPDADSPGGGGAEWASAGVAGGVQVDTRPLALAPQQQWLHVRACNEVGLCSGTLSAEAPMLLTSERPSEREAGVSLKTFSRGVLDGRDGTSAQLDVSWNAFRDPTEAVAMLKYEVCVGTTPFGCQLVPFAAAAGWHWSGSDLSLQCSATYYAAVRATNCAGLQSTAISTGAKLCCEPPVASSEVLLRDVESGTLVESVGAGVALSASWNFGDVCAAIQAYNVTLGPQGEGALLWSSLVGPSHAATTIEEGVTQGMSDGRYEVAVAAISHSGLVTERTATLVLDREPPSATPPKIRVSGEDAWVHGRTCMSVAAVYVDVHWDAFSDAASDVARYSYSVHTATNDSSPPSMAHWVDVAAARQSRLPAYLLRANASETSLTYFRVRGCDTAGHCAHSAWSEPLLVVPRPPAGGHVRLSAMASPAMSASPHASLPAPSFVNPFSLLNVNASLFVAAGCPSAYMYDETCSASQRRVAGLGCNAGGAGQNCRACGFGDLLPRPGGEDLSSQLAGELSYEVCVGTTPFGCQLVPFTAATGGDWSSRGELPLQCGTSYYAVARATNCAGLQRSVVSSAVKLCCEQPVVSGAMRLHDGEGAPVAFVSNSSATVFALWGGFAESCSGVRSLVVSLVDSAAPAASLWRLELSTEALSVELPISVLGQLSHGVSVRVEVEAMSNAGLSTRLTASLTVDRTPPRVAVLKHRRASLSTVEQSGRPVCVPSGSDSLELDWSSMADEQSGSEDAAVSLFVGEGVNATLVSEMHVQGGLTMASVALPTDLSTGVVIVTACNRLRSCTNSTPLGLRLVSEAPEGGPLAPLLGSTS